MLVEREKHPCWGICLRDHNSLGSLNTPKNLFVPLSPQKTIKSHSHYLAKEPASLPKRQVKEELLDHSPESLWWAYIKRKFGEKNPKYHSQSYNNKEYGPSIPPPSDKEYSKRAWPETETFKQAQSYCEFRWSAYSLGNWMEMNKGTFNKISSHERFYESFS